MLESKIGLVFASILKNNTVMHIQTLSFYYKIILDLLNFSDLTDISWRVRT